MKRAAVEPAVGTTRLLGDNQDVVRITGIIALVAMLMVVIDPLWCPDGCTDESASTHATDSASCSVCQRSLPTASAAVSTLEIQPASIVTVEYSTMTPPDAWCPRIDRPPRRA